MPDYQEYWYSADKKGYSGTAIFTRFKPVAVINGRISRRSFRGYRCVRWLLPQLRFIDLYCVQIDVYPSSLARECR